VTRTVDGDILRLCAIHAGAAMYSSRSWGLLSPRATPVPKTLAQSGYWAALKETAKEYDAQGMHR
jgi:hypothetical protein